MNNKTAFFGFLLLLTFLLHGCGKFETSNGVPVLNQTEEISAGEIFLASEQGLSRSSDFGKSWSYFDFCESADSNICFSSISAISRLPQGLLLSGRFNGVSLYNPNSQEKKYLAGGESFQGGHAFKSIYATNRIFTGTAYGLFVSDDLGLNWYALLLNSPANRTNHIVDFVVFNENIYAISGGGSFFESKDNGETWTETRAGQGSFFTGETFPLNLSNVEVNSKYIFVASREGGLVRKTRQSNEWEKMTPELNGFMDAQYISSLHINENSVYAGSRYGGVAVSHDSGDSWNLINHENSQGFSENIFVTSIFSYGQSLYIGTYTGNLLVSNHGSNIWVGFPNFVKRKGPIYDIYIE